MNIIKYHLFSAHLLISWVTGWGLPEPMPKLDGCLHALEQLFSLRGKHLLEYEVNLSLQGRRGRSVDFQVREYEKFTDEVSDSTLQTNP